MLRRLRRRWIRILAARRRRVEAALYGDGVAYRRSRNLLRRYLDAEQRRDFERRRAFTVRGPSGRFYRIGHAASINIDVLGPSGAVEYRLCAGPLGVPVPAVMLAQKLMLEGDEAAFLRVAIRHPVHPHGY